MYKNETTLTVRPFGAHFMSFSGGGESKRRGRSISIPLNNIVVCEVQKKSNY